MDNAMKSSSVASSSLSSEQQMNIYLKANKTVSFKVKKSDTISYLKALFREKEGISEQCQEIFFSGERLNDEQNLADCNIQENSTLNLYVKNSEVLKLFITKISNQKTVEIEAKFKETIEAIKSKICLKEGTNLPNHDQFSLYNAGILLDASRTLASLGIKGNSTLHLVLNPKDSLWFSFELPDGKIVKTEVKILLTVADVKAFVCSIVGACFKDQYLTYEEEELEESKTLACYQLKEYSFLRIGPRKIQIFMRGKKNLPIYVLEDDKISSVKQQVLRKLGFSQDAPYILGFHRRTLDDNRYLASYGIKKHCTLDLGIVPTTFTIKSAMSDIADESQIKPTTTILELKKLIPSLSGLIVKKLDLNGHILTDDYTLAHYKIDEDTVLRIHYRKR